MSAIESVLVENRVFPPSEATVKAARISGMAAYEALCEEAEKDFEGFWARLARDNVVWTKPFTRTLDESNAPFYKWFDDGELNASANCLDKHIGTPVENKTAIIFEADDGAVTQVTYKELLARVSQFANALKAQGIKKGDRVIIYMPMTHRGRGRHAGLRAHRRHPQRGVRRLLGQGAERAHHRCRRRGRDHRQLPDARRQGTAAQGHRRRRHRAWAAATRSRPCWCTCAPPTACNMVAGRDKTFTEVLQGQSTECRPEPVGAEHPLFILYTSGSTGKPKGVQHSTGGYLLWAKLTMDWTFDIKPGGRVLVHRRHRLDHGPHLRGLRPAGGRRHAGHVRGHPDLPERGPLLADDREAQGHACSTPRPRRSAR